MGLLTDLEQLGLSWNGLNGTIPAELGELTRLERLWLSNNELFGRLPWSLTILRKLNVFHYQDTKLCAPPSPVFAMWLDGIADFRGLTCGPEGTPNHPPVPRSRIPDVRLNVGGSARTLNMHNWFSDPDNDTLRYTTSTAPSGRVRARVESGFLVVLSAVAAGTARVTVTAWDPNDLRAQQTIHVTVDPEIPNRPPVARGRIEDQNLSVGDRPSRISSVELFFHDPDGDRLHIWASSSDRSTVVVHTFTTSSGGDDLRLSPVAVGTATVTVTARDPHDRTANQRFRVTVSDGTEPDPPEPDPPEPDPPEPDPPEPDPPEPDPPTQTDRQVLEKLYDATGGPNWRNSTNWKTSAPLDQWHGVQTDAAGRVTVLDLYFNNLTGSLPSELGRLANLQALYLGSNRITGSIPTSLGNLTNLRQVILINNLLTGSIPASLGRLTRLDDLWLNSNRLTGSVPSELGNLSNLEQLDLARNQLSGELPSSLTDLNKLRLLSFVANDGLCAPSDEAFQAWLRGIAQLYGPTCDP